MKLANMLNMEQIFFVFLLLCICIQFIYIYYLLFKLKEIEHQVMINAMCDPLFTELRNRAKCIWLDTTTTNESKYNALEKLLNSDIDNCDTGLRQERKMLVNMINDWLNQLE